MFVQLAKGFVIEVVIVIMANKDEVYVWELGDSAGWGTVALGPCQPDH